jgi:hypothetical protein
METTGFIKMSDRSEATGIDKLRLEAYSNAPEFTLTEPDAIKWSSADDDNIVLTAYSSDQPTNPLATTSARLLSSAESSEEIMECKWINDEWNHLFPALLLGKGATAKGSHNHGLHSVLRYYLIKAALKCNFKSLLGIVFESAPRTRLMCKIGYQFIMVESFWYTDLKPNKATLIGILQQEKFQYAAKMLHDEFETVINNYPLNETSLYQKMKVLSLI